MALSRRSGRVSANVWPGFVDAMTALLLVLFFVLTIFMVVQFVLRETITGQETELDQLSVEVNTLARALGLEQQRAAGLEDRVGSLTQTLNSARDQAERQAALIASLRSESAAQREELAERSARITDFEAQVASLLAERDDALAQGAELQADVAELETARQTLLSEREALNLALARARNEIDAQTEAARLAAAQREALDTMLAEMRAKAEEQEGSLADALARLDAAQGREATLSQRLTATELAREAAATRSGDLAERLSESEAARLRDAAAAEALRQRLAGVEAELTDEERRRLAAAAAAEALRARLESADAELTAMTLALEEQRRKAEDTLTLLAAAEAARNDALAETERALTDADRQAGLLAAARSRLADEEAASAEAQRDVALLNQQVAALRGQLGELRGLLDDARDREAAADVRIQTLGSDLNVALARVAAEERRRAELEEAERKRLEEEARRLAEETARLQDETAQLEKVRSEFFAQLSQVLAGREGVRVVGDRFVFSSEVLFQPGQVELLPEGRAQIARVVEILNDVRGQIPQGIDWVIRVDGHTDTVPLSRSGRYRDNWELSQGRALSVVRYMIDELGFPPERLAATGFGEYQPVEEGDSPEALAQNRRIELKLTER